MHAANCSLMHVLLYHILNCIVMARYTEQTWYIAMCETLHNYDVKIYTGPIARIHTSSSENL